MGFILIKSTAVHSSSSLRRTLHLHNINQLLYPAIVLVLLCSCSSTKPVFNPDKKYSAAQLHQDYNLFQRILEERHPGLYWYTPQPAMDSAFEAGRHLITGSLTEQGFRKILMAVITNIQCGHTTVQPSKGYMKYTNAIKDKAAFPFTIKTWNDTAVFVNASLKNIPLRTGDIIDSFNHKPLAFLIDTMYRFISADGNNPVAKSQRISIGNNFGALYTLLYGRQTAFQISYKDSLGQSQTYSVKQAPVKKDTAQKQEPKKEKKLSKADRLQQARSFEIHKNEGYALMQLNSFSEKLQLKKFFRQSFRELNETGTSNLIIDLRLNGGGRLSNSNYLMRYLSDHPYKTADSIYAIASKSKYSKYIGSDFWTKLLVKTSTKKMDGKFRYRYFEKHYYKPRKQNQYKGHVYLLSGGLTYSASTLVLNTLKGQHNITIVGEPSGGGAYGNTAMIISDVTLPATKVRFRLPMFRMVIDKSLPKNGQGVQPDVFAGPAIDAIRREEDYKMKKVMELIKGQ